MKKCSECRKIMLLKKGLTTEGIPYNYYSCKCGEEILDMKQLNTVAERYRKLKSYKSKLSKWGESLGLRVPKELVQEYHLKEKEEITIIPEKGVIKLIVS